MKAFIPREKLGKKDRKRLDAERRAAWAFSPVTRKVESKKLYNRRKKPHDRYDDYGMGVFFDRETVDQCLSASQRNDPVGKTAVFPHSAQRINVSSPES